MVEHFFRDLSDSRIAWQLRIGAPSLLTPSTFTSHDITWNQNTTVWHADDQEVLHGNTRPGRAATDPKY